MSKTEHKPSLAFLETLLAESAQRHNHLCPRQVLGVRMGLYGLRLLGLIDETYQPRFMNDGKRLLVFVETDGCGLDGVAVATHCFVGRRTLRVEDYGKMAATLADRDTGRMIRVAPRKEARALVQTAVTNAPSKWHAYLEGYKLVTDEALLTAVPVQLKTPLGKIISQPGKRVSCAVCSEEIMNEREITRLDGTMVCQMCAGQGYYVAL